MADQDQRNPQINQGTFLMRGLEKVRAEFSLTGSCPTTWCSNGAAEQGWLLVQAARDGTLAARLSLSGATVSCVM
jgi:hypothetical protein